MVYTLLALIDVVLISASFFLACLLYLGSVSSFGGLILLAGSSGEAGSIAIVVAYSVVLAVAYALSSVYGQTYIGRIRLANAWVVVIDTTGIVVVTGLLFLLHLDDVSRMTLFVFYLVSTAVVCVKTWVSYRVLLLARKNKRRTQKTIVVGDGPLAVQYIEAVNENSSRFEQIVGYIAVERVVYKENAIEHSIGNAERIGFIADIDDILRASDADKVVIALEPDKYYRINMVMNAADTSGVELELVPFYNDIIPRRPDVDSVNGVKLVNLRSMPLSNPLNAAIKRFADVAISSLIIVFFSWLFAIAAIGVKASSPGPVFFKQERIGRNGKTFTILKFRSMRPTEESVSTFTENKDDRLTRFGRIIRKLSIDELPQFFNVLAGQMSVIGPRPILVEETNVYRDAVPRYMLRNQVRPGVSGLAQVKGLRGGTELESIRERTDADLWYIEHWSPWLDIKIFFITIFGGFISSERVF